MAKKTNSFVVVEGNNKDYVLPTGIKINIKENEYIICYPSSNKLVKGKIYKTLVAAEMAKNNM